MNDLSVKSPSGREGELSEGGREDTCKLPATPNQPAIPQEFKLNAVNMWKWTVGSVVPIPLIGRKLFVAYLKRTRSTYLHTPGWCLTHRTSRWRSIGSKVKFMMYGVQELLHVHALMT